MSSTDSLVVKCEPLAPRRAAHAATAPVSSWTFGLSTVGQRSAPAPVPRWSNTTSSRERRAGDERGLDRLAQRRRRLAGPAGQDHQHVGATRTAGYALDQQAQGARRGSAAVERDAHPGAQRALVLARAAVEGHRRHGGPAGSDQRSSGKGRHENGQRRPAHIFIVPTWRRPGTLQDMDSLRGQLLIAAPALSDFFARSVVLVIEHTEEGALGIVLNRPTEAPVNGHRRAPRRPGRARGRRARGRARVARLGHRPGRVRGS